MADEYIKREAAILAICEEQETAFYRFNVGGAVTVFAVDVKERIKKIKGVDVAPVRHGRWINHGWTVVCSECGEDYAFAKRNYCPNCGARMEKGDYPNE